MRISVGSGRACVPGLRLAFPEAHQLVGQLVGVLRPCLLYNCAAEIECNIQLISVSHDAISHLIPN
jgi:hypothetical protein